MEFVSENGSTLKISGKFNGIYDIDFDWFEEGACCEGHPKFNEDMDEPAIIVYCECCGQQKIKLKPA